ncbi:hypothetical protein COU76_05135, partial [Candidatus Peregrinibacteria bacterium CG10_big_fil_rev_8_21_14_0_10_49_10]
FTLGEVYKVPKNNNRTFRVYADLSGGKTTDTLDFYIDEAADLTAIDAQAGYGARVTNNMAKANVTDTTFQGGKITLADNGPVAQNVAINTTNVELFNFAITADRDLTFKDYYLWLEQTAFDGTTAKNITSTTVTSAAAMTITTAGLATFRTNADDAANLAQYDVVKVTSGGIDYYIEIDSTGGAVANTNTTNTTGTLVYPSSVSATVTFTNGDAITKVYDTHLREKVENVRLIDADTGATLASQSTSEYAMLFSDDFDIDAGETRNLQVVVDLDSALVANNAFKGGVNFGDANFIKDNDANEFVATADCVSCNTFGKTMTAVASSLVLSRASTPVSETHVKGQDGVDLLGVSAKAGDGGDVKVLKVTVRLVADDDGTFDNSGYGDLAANTLVDSVSLYKVNGDGTEVKLANAVGLTAVGTIGSSGGYYKAEFNDFLVDGATVATYDIAQSVSEKWVVKADLRSSVSATRYLAADVISASDVEAQDKDGNTVNPSGTINGLGSSLSVTKTIATAGTLTGASEGNPNASVLIAGATAQTFAKYKYSAQNEAFTVKKLDIVMDEDSSFTDTPETTYARALKRVGLTYTKKDGTSTTVYADLASGKASFTNLELYVPKDGSAFVTVIGDLNTVENGAVSGDTIRLGLNEQSGTANNAFEALGEGSSEQRTVANLSTYSSSSTVKTMTLRKAAPTVAKLSTAGTKLNNGQNDIAAITVAADAGKTVSLKRLAFEYDASDMTVNSLGFFRKIGSGSEGDITTDVSIRNRQGQNLKSGGSDLSTAGATTTDTIYVTWDKAATDQENVSGTTNTYIVRATVSAAAANESLSTFIADDTATFNAPTSGVAGLRTFTGSNPETVAASINGTRTVWYWIYADSTNCANTNTSGCVVLDTTGQGMGSVSSTVWSGVTATADPVIAVQGTGTSSLTSGAIVAGALRHTTDDVDAGGNGNDGIYFDINGDGNYTAAADLAIPVTAATGAAPTDDALVTSDVRWTTTGPTLYFDTERSGASANTFNAAHDDNVTLDAMLNEGSITTANNAEVYTSGWNFIWSDNSAVPHTTSTTDWTNGTDINSLPTQSVSLSF